MVCMEDPPGVETESGGELQLVLPDLSGKAQTELECAVNINADLPVDKKKEVSKIIQSFSAVISDKPGKTSLIEHKIVLNTDKTITSKPYPLPFQSRKIVEKEVKDMLDMGIIEPSTSPYCSPIVLVKKTDGTYRFCIDFRKLNAVTVQDAEPIPYQEELLNSFGGSFWFSKMDLTKGYWEIPLEENSRKYTAFQTPLGLFQFKMMPFGLCNAPATFARLMRIVFSGTLNVVTFFDDIAIHSKTWEEHLTALESVLHLLSVNGLTAKPSKMYLGYRDILFLGHVISHDTQRPDPKKINSMISLGRPQTKKQVRSLLGVIGYYRKFIHNFAGVAEPLTTLVRAGQPDRVIWSESCQKAFQTVLDALNSNPILILPNFREKFFLRTDASDVGVGACLLQRREDLLHPVTYVSRKLLPRETRYSIIEKECLAIVWSVNKLSRYLLGTKFYIESDHRPLLFLAGKRSTSARLMRWALSLQPFVFDIAHIKGSENNLADLLSRDFY